MKKKHYPKKCGECFKIYEKSNKDTYGADTYLNDFPSFGLEKGTCNQCKSKETNNGRSFQDKSRSYNQRP